MLFAAIVFALTYLFMMLLPKRRALVVLAGAALFLIGGTLTAQEALEALDLNVLFMIAGTMGIVAMVSETGAPKLLADLLVEKVPEVKGATLVLSLFAGVVSAFIDNVSTVIMVAPVALEIARRRKMNPTGMVIAIAVSSNLQGAATLVGDTTSILLGAHAGMNFMDFFVYKGRPGIFFAVELGALCAAAVLIILFRKEKGRVQAGERTKVSDWIPGILMVLAVLALIGASFIPNTPHMTNGIICMAAFLLSVADRVLREKSVQPLKDAATGVDMETLLILTGLFIMVSGLTAQGIIDVLADFIASLGGGNIFLIYTLLLWMSVIFSAFIDNIPYVATMLPVVGSVASSVGSEPELLYFGLLCGATLGGNLTPVGASANITGIGLLRKNRFEVKNKDFMRIGVPFTLAAIIPAYIFFLLFYY